jgi:hypothetical protein
MASGQRARLGLQPVANDAGALLAISWPGLREGVVHHVVGFDAKGLLDELGSLIAVVAADGLFEQVGHGVRLTVLRAARRDFRSR